LPGSSEDALAISQEGTYLFANESYSPLFGYLNDDSMICLPVIDNISAEDRPRMKRFLKPIEAVDTETIQFAGITNNETPVPIEIRIAKVVELINGVIFQTAKKHNTSTFLYTTIDRYLNTQKEIGLQKIEYLVYLLVEKIKTESKDSTENTAIH
jgi:hypothetical protein